MRKIIFILLCIPSLCMADDLCKKLTTPQVFSDHFEAYTLIVKNDSHIADGTFTEAATKTSNTVFGLCQYNRLRVRIDDNASGEIKGMLVYNPYTKLTEFFISKATFHGRELVLSKMTANID